MESNTPRTDIFLANWDRYNFPEDAIEHARQLEAELDTAKLAVQSITQDYVGMCAVVRGLEAKVTEEVERVDQWKSKYEHQHELHITAKDELDAAKRALADEQVHARRFQYWLDNCGQQPFLSKDWPPFGRGSRYFTKEEFRAVIDAALAAKSDDL